MQTRTGAIVWTLLAASACAAAPPPRDVADVDVDRSIGELKRYLYGQQAPDGHFRHYSYNVPSGGATALAVFALLEAGETTSEQRLVKGLDALAALETKNLYVIAVRVMALSQVAKDARYRKQLAADVDYLTRNALRAGAWGYGGPEPTGDNSCSQFALLALWEADRAGVQINPALIRRVETTWLARQRRDGGWTYAGQADVDTPSTITMTTAAAASLYVCQDVLTNTCVPYRHQKQADRAWAYLAEHLKDDYHANGYLAFCVQRVGMASGRKFIAGMDWFAVGAAKLCEPNPQGRGYGGQWGPVVRASFELIFLARGRVPLTFNKLAHGDEQDWNYHARDLAHFTEYMRRSFERRMRWQVVRITDDVRMLLDAPMLMVTGSKPPAFDDQQWGKIRQYGLRGGTALFVPTHQGDGFAEAVRQRLGGLFAPDRAAAGGHFELAKLPGDHPLYNGHLDVPGGERFAEIWGVSDGTRLLAVLCLRDIPCAWQRWAEKTSKGDYHLGVNFFMYATGGSPLRMHLRPVFVAKPGEVRHRAKVAWLRHGGLWGSQPYALETLSQKLTAENFVAIDVTAGAAITDEGLAGQDLAWMTGTEKFALSDAELAALRRYIDGGGTLFVNAVGGAEAFRLAAEEMISKLLAGRDAPGRFVMPGSPLMTGVLGEFRGPRIETLHRTLPWRRVSEEAPPGPMRAYADKGRTVVVFAPYGIHDTLDGHTAWAARSYMPDSARDLAANVVLNALSNRIK
ncbi:MAG TPA: DUF4159 domain-containing protein [Phycisphaerae bacterium]|nr:DUF4159 domain-containing protein [Phycisphaerae bacterium]